MLNVLSATVLELVALITNLLLTTSSTALGVPEIVPVDEILKPLGKLPAIVL
jgi:hypothetical protein